ncbi:MAG TPA: sulfite exporter TauE/SafE family protein [Solirubrobacteraceae bacterium]|nr:sulfite exporter TauE/SafE family protein [Solirubrobacteraceae bacterium]
MSPLECVLVLAAGVFAGAINTVVGSGTLVTFPVLLAVGYGPVVANVSNTLGLVPGSVSGAIGYRRELAGQRRRALVLAGASLLGGITGAVLLLSLPGSAFEAIVPVLIALALVLVVGQPRLSRALAARRERVRPHGGPLLWGGVFGTGIYGGYFGAAQGVILLAILGIAIPEDMQRLNALKNVLAALVNGVAAVIFVVFASVAWLPALLLAAGSAAGGQLGARIGRRLSPAVLRAVIVVVGVAAIAQLVT